MKSIDAQLDAITFDVEPINADLVEIRDALWAIERDRLRSADAVLDLATGTPEIHALPGLASIQTALSALDRVVVPVVPVFEWEMYALGAQLYHVCFVRLDVEVRIDGFFC